VLRPPRLQHPRDRGHRRRARAAPGESFDLNAHVGPRDTARGFVEAPQILEGQFVNRVGGGVSQFATALFNAVFFSGLEDVTHTPHSYWIKRYPPGREATVSYPLPDLIFKNDSPHGVLIDTSYTGTSSPSRSGAPSASTRSAR
jgi:vancomycin resistance protein YoaR